MVHPLIRLFWGAAVVLALLWSVAEYRRPSSLGARTALEQLATAEKFGLGSSLRRGREVDPKDDLFLVILQDRHADALFRELFERGTPAAKTYALAGLHLTDGFGFKECASKFSTESVLVKYSGGCFGGEWTPPEAVQEIRNRLAETFLRWRNEIIQNPIKPAKG